MACLLSLSLPIAAHAAPVLLPAPGADAWVARAIRRGKTATRYTTVEIDGRTAMRAESHCSASFMFLSLAGLDLRRTPLLQWQWKVERGLPAHDERNKAGDDFAARVYVMFRFEPGQVSTWERAKHRLRSKIYGHELPGRVIDYVWSSHAAEGTAWNDPYTSITKMISRGSGLHSDWTTERVDVARDYASLFGDELPPLLGLAVMTDADNLCGNAIAYFADFRFLPGEDDEPDAP
jgi:hypothetical protein